MMPIVEQIFPLIILSLAVASVAWTVTQEEIFREQQEFCRGRCKAGRTLFERKFFYVFTCEYCFSHWVTLFFLLLSGYRLLLDDWRGYVIAFFVIPWLANQWMSMYRRLRVEIKKVDAVAEIVKEKADDGKE
jgi:hypothetical protein